MGDLVWYILIWFSWVQDLLEGVVVVLFGQDHMVIGFLLQDLIGKLEPVDDPKAKPG